MKLKLPSGSGVDTSAITQWGVLNEKSHVWNEKTLYVDPGVTLDVVLYGHIKATYNNTDARALYAWLTANSTAIGEDGVVLVDEKLPRVKDFLIALVRGDVDAQFTQRAIDTYNMTRDTLMSMAKDGAIRSGLQGWEITQRGRDYLELFTMEIN
jgi:hypothetical protein